MSSLGSWGWQRRTPPVPALIERMFAELVPVYDRSNTLLSFGLHRWWRWQAVRYAGAASGMAVLDCATGTGDFAFAFLAADSTDGTARRGGFLQANAGARPDEGAADGHSGGVGVGGRAPASLCGGHIRYRRNRLRNPQCC
jgi:hypothetical protein